MALLRHMQEDRTSEPLIHLVLRLLVEVEALREALSGPDTPEPVRQAYRRAYERIAVLSHNAAGPSGGTEKVLRHFLPQTAQEEPYAAERMMMERLGATEDEVRVLCAKMEEVSMYT